MTPPVQVPEFPVPSSHWSWGTWNRKQGTLPLFTSEHPHTRDIADVHAISRPARTFTGDFYFTHRYADRLWFALGDVAGKGLNAAVVMAMIQEELEQRIRACANTRCDPAATMTRLDTFLRPLLPINRFATAVIGHLRDDGMLALTNAGHCPPLVVRKSGVVEEVASTGPAVGILPSASWRFLTTQLAPGETLVLYSDGVSEGRTAAGCEVGVNGVRDAVSRAEGSVRRMAESILQLPASTDDDATVMVVRRR